MKLKSLLFGSAAVIAAGTGAQAADLPVAEPVEYVRICDAFGTGFFYIPGTDTCLRVSGRVRIEAHYVDFDTDDTAGPDADFNNFTTRARGNIRLDARTQTDIGLVRAYINFQMTLGPTDFGNYSESPALDQAFIQISNDAGTFTAGHVDSFFDAPFSSNTFGTRVGIDDPTDSQTLFGYTASFGGPFSASVSIEDPLSDARRLDGDDDYEGQEWPDLVVNARYTAGWGQLFAAAALRHIHDKEGFPGLVDNDCDGDGDPTTGPLGECSDDDDGFGWAVNAGGIAEFGMFSAGLTVGYADGAIDYITNDPGGVGDFDGPSGEDTNQAWAIRGGIGIEFTPTLSSYIDASYTAVDDDAGDDDYDFWAVAANLIWSPVPGLIMGPEVAYSSIDFDDGDDDEADVWSAMFRIQRDF
jgi:hypothetical protein